MKKLIPGLLLFFFLSPAQAVNQEISTAEKQLANARSASMELLTTLKTQLTSAMESGGPESAIVICSVIGQQLAVNISEKNDLEIKRVSLKARNPLGQPDDFEKDALKNFDFLNRENMLKPDHEFFAVVKESNQKHLRYMKPIVTAKMCLQCHGSKENIKPQVLKVLSEKYPNDAATGYKEGEIRGAVSVKINMH